MVSASDFLAGLSLAVSGVTVWFSMFRRGTVKMTQPAFIYFGPDGGHGKPKLATCVHLYCTAERGRIVEGLHVRITCNGTTTNFDVWVYGSDGLARGSGVFVGRDGVTCNHHFLLPRTDVPATSWVLGSIKLPPHPRSLGKPAIGLRACDSAFGWTG